MKKENGTKICKDCQLEKPLEMFRKSGNNHRNDCRSCENQKRIQRRNVRCENDPIYKDTLREYDKERKRRKRREG